MILPLRSRSWLFLERASACKAGVNVMIEADFVAVVELVAKENFAVVEDAGEIDEAAGYVLNDDAFFANGGEEFFGGVATGFFGNGGVVERWCGLTVGVAVAVSMAVAVTITVGVAIAAGLSGCWGGGIVGPQETVKLGEDGADPGYECVGFFGGEVLFKMVDHG
jgi:hypothetical protein